MVGKAPVVSHLGVESVDIAVLRNRQGSVHEEGLLILGIVVVIRVILVVFGILGAGAGRRRA